MGDWVGLGGCFFFCRRNHAQTQHFSNIINTIAGQSIQQKTHSQRKLVGSSMPHSLPDTRIWDSIKWPEIPYNPSVTHHDSNAVSCQSAYQALQCASMTQSEIPLWHTTTARRCRLFFTPVSWPDSGTWQHEWSEIPLLHTTAVGFFMPLHLQAFSCCQTYQTPELDGMKQSEILLNPPHPINCRILQAFSSLQAYQTRKCNSMKQSEIPFKNNQKNILFVTHTINHQLWQSDFAGFHTLE